MPLKEKNCPPGKLFSVLRTILHSVTPLVTPSDS